MKPAVLSLLPRPPHPSRDGLAIRNYHLLEALAERFTVRALCLVDPERAYGGGEAPRGVDVELVLQLSRGPRRAVAAAASILTGRAYSELLYRSAAMARRVAEEARASSPRWILAHSYHVAPLAMAAGRPVWIDFHNVDSEIWSRTGVHASSSAVRLFARAQARRVRALERDLVNRADGISCVSERDAATLSSLGAGLAPLVVPNGVSLSRYAFETGPRPEDLVLFVGDLSWPPNAEGVRWFGDRVWPLVRRLCPGARAEVLGRGASADLRQRAAPDFVFAGEGEDTRPYWARAAVAVVPIFSGGGTRLKILEAAACGAPVVSTSVGAEGLELSAGTEILVRDEPAEFAAAIARLLGDRPAAGRQAAAARARVEARYDWERIGREFARELSERLDRPR